MTETVKRVLKPIGRCVDSDVTKFELVSTEEVDNYLIEFKLYDKYTGTQLNFKSREGNETDVFIKRMIVGEDSDSLNKLKPDNEYVELEIGSRDNREILRLKSIEILNSITKGSTIISMSELSVEDGVYTYTVEANLDSGEISTITDDVCGELELIK